ncbi:MAG: biopolymer transporter ExbD [Planctomycetota bacterium]
MKFLRDTGPASDSKLQMTPMIDIVFQILVFFFVASKFRIPEGELEAYLPKDQGPAKKLEVLTPEPEIRVTIRATRRRPGEAEARPTYEVTRAPGGGIEMDVDRTVLGGLRTLQTEIRQHAQDKQVREEVPVILEVEPTVKYKWVIKAVSICRGEGFQQVEFAASKRNNPLEPPDG